jgi:5-methylcytosine-specific restriction endonuclease McrA
MQTLVLDRSYQPINVVPWQKAISYLARERATVLEEYPTQLRAGMAMPAVVTLNHSYQRQKQRVKFSRHNLLARDKNRCQYCGQKLPASELTYEHVIPRCQGGTTCWENVVMACVACNKQKANRTPEQAGMKLLTKPARPSWIPQYNPRLRSSQVPPEWRDYWTVELEP